MQPDALPQQSLHFSLVQFAQQSVALPCDVPVPQFLQQSVIVQVSSQHLHLASSNVVWLYRVEPRKYKKPATKTIAKRFIFFILEFDLGFKKCLRTFHSLKKLSPKF
jgi:hypothetical protein